MTEAPASSSFCRSTLYQACWLAALFAVLKFAIHLFSNVLQAHLGWGYFSDEPYYIICGEHLDWGYVDHGPIVALQARLAVLLFGKSLAGIRMFATLAGAVKIALTGILTWQLGGRRHAQALAMLGALLCPEFLAIDSYLSMNAFEPVFWLTATIALLAVVSTRNTKWWIVFGAAAGLGFENKPSILFFLAALLLAVVVTPERKVLVSRGFSLGVVVGCLLVLPNLLWQTHHGWATFEFLRASSAARQINSPGILSFFLKQAVMLGAMSLPLVAAGLLWLLRGAKAKSFRFLGYGYLLFLIAMVAMRAKEYYLTPVYPVLFAAGGVALVSVATSKLRRRVLLGYVSLLVVLEIIGAPMVLPVLSPKGWLDYAVAIHARSRAVESKYPFPGFFALRFGWQELADQVTDVYESLPLNERKEAGIFCANYNMASAINFLGRGRGLPLAISGHNNYFIWGPNGETGTVMIVVTSKSREQLLVEYAEAEQVGTMSHPYALAWDTHIFLCKGRKQSLVTTWLKQKDYF